MLTGRFTESNPLTGYIGTFPRMNGDNFKHNLKLVDQVKAFAEKKGCTSAQLALAWVRAASERDGNPAVVPIPGSTTPQRVQENSKAIKLSEEEYKELTAIVDYFETAGGRYPAQAAFNT